MAIFMVVPIGPSELIEAALVQKKSVDALDFLKLPTSGYFVAHPGTSQELSDAIGLTEGTTGVGIVVAVSSYYGRATNDIWEWVSSRWDD